MSLGDVLGGALQGIGAGMVAQGRMDMEVKAEAVKQDAIARREAWLESTRHGNKLTELDAASKLQRDEQTNQYDLMDRNDARHTGRTTSSQIAVDKAKTANDMALSRLNSSLQMTREQTMQAQKLADEVSLLGIKAEKFEITADGSMVAINGAGKIISRSEKGRFVVPRSGSESLGDGSSLLGPSPTAAPTQGAKPLPTKNITNRPPLASFQQ